jgi:hypothetical protein
METGAEETKEPKGMGSVAQSLLRNPSFYRTKSELIKESVRELTKLPPEKPLSPDPTPRLREQVRFAGECTSG